MKYFVMDDRGVKEGFPYYTLKDATGEKTSPAAVVMAAVVAAVVVVVAVVVEVGGGGDVGGDDRVSLSPRGTRRIFDSLGNAPETYHRRFAHVLIVNGPQYYYRSSQIQSDDTDTYDCIASTTPTSNGDIEEWSCRI